MSFGSNLKKIRLDNDLTQEGLAKKLNTSRSNIANYENDKNMPSVEILEKISKTLNCSTDYLMGLTSYKNPKEDLEKELYLLDLSSNEFEEMISSFSDKDFDKLENILNSDSKLAQACNKCCDLINDYILSDANIIDDASFDKLIALVKSLDKSKIIHNYNKGIDLDEADIAFATGVKGLNETNKMIIKNTLEALLAKQEKDEEGK